MIDRDRKLSKFLSLVLRHRPDILGIDLDANGWVDIPVLLAAMETAGYLLDESLLKKIVAQSDKQRFKISEDGKRIRANQGHSVVVDLQLTEKRPPDLLYHGTVEKFLGSIMQQGLVPGSRHHVHLSKDRETAIKVASRRGKPVVLLVDARLMFAEGVKFFESDNGVWLTDHVAVGFLRRENS